MPEVLIHLHPNYRFYEKPTTSRVCLQPETALGKNGLVQSLVEEVKRRMLNTSNDMPMSTWCRILDEFAQKMLNSGHSVEHARRNILSGVKGYESKVRKCIQNDMNERVSPPTTTEETPEL